MYKLGDLVLKLKEFIDAFNTNGNDVQNARTAEELMKVLEQLQDTTFEKGEDDIQLAKIYSSAITLWNICVAMRNGKKSSNMVNAKVRHVACHLTFLASASEMTESSWRRKLPLAVKTGKAWLDCKNAKMADDCFKLASECWDKIQFIRESKLTNSPPNSKDDLQMQECELMIIKLYAYRAEVAFIFGDDESSIKFISKAKEVLAKYPKQCSLLATFCYNFGVESFQKGFYKKSISWLRESYEIGKGFDGEVSSGSKVQATCLRLIAKAYYEIGGEDNVTLALNSVDLSLSEESNPRSFYLKLKIILQMNDSTEAQIISILDGCINHSELTVDLAVQVFKLITQSKSQSLIAKALDLLRKRFQKKNETTKLQAEYMEFLLEDNQQQAARDLIDSELISGIKQLPQSDASTVQKFHFLVWAQAAKFFEAEAFEDALRWYTFSLDCFANTLQESKDIAKLQASEIIEEAYKLERDSAQTSFIHLKICLASADDDKAIWCVDKLSEFALQEPDSNLIHGFICLAAQMAFQDGNKKIAVYALDKITQQTKEPKQLLTALRCLTRLKYTYISPINQSEEFKTILTFIKKAYETLKKSPLAEFESEIQWFSKIAWNLGLACQDKHQDMLGFFILCYELSSLMPDGGNKVQQKTCLMMASAAGIEATKSIADENEKASILKDLLSYLQTCEKIYSEIKGGIDDKQKDKEDPTEGILACLEFEVKAMLGYSNLDVILDKAKTLPHMNAKVLETMAASVFSISQKYKAVGKKALKMAVKFHLESDHTDYLQLSKDLHTLVNVSINEGGNSNAQSKEEAFQYYQNILEILQKAPKNAYPEMETLWLMTKAWNCGVYLFRCTGTLDSIAQVYHQGLKIKGGLHYHYLSGGKGLSEELDGKTAPLCLTMFADMLERRERISVINQMEE